MMPKGKEWVWILVGIAFALFLLPLIQAKLNGATHRKTVSANV